MSLCNEGNGIVPRTEENYTVVFVIYPMQKATDSYKILKSSTEIVKIRFPIHNTSPRTG